MKLYQFILTILVVGVAAVPQLPGERNYLPPGTRGPGNAPISEVSVVLPSR
jgi:hypothetical protein